MSQPLPPSPRPPISAAFFCPHVEPPDQAYLSAFHAFLSHNQHGQRLLQQIATLETQNTWDVFAAANPHVKAIARGPEYLQILRDWAVNGTSTHLSAVQSGIVGLSMVAILHVGQYLRFLEFYGVSHGEFLREAGVGGLQGYCAGMSGTLAIACAKDEGEVVGNLIVILRVLVGVAAYSEGAEAAEGYGDGCTQLAMRLEYEGQGDELVAAFPGTYISGVAEPKLVCIVGKPERLEEVFDRAKELGLLVLKLHVRGKVHNPENGELAGELVRVCEGGEGLRLMDSGRLEVPVRSNRTGERLCGVDSLTEELVATILSSRSEWFEVVSRVAGDLSSTGRGEHCLVVFGMTDAVSMIPFDERGQTVNKIQAHTLIQSLGSQGPLRWEIPELSDDAIAVVGTSCRLPGADNLEELWGLLSKGADCHREVPTDRFELYTSFRGSTQNGFPPGRKFYGNFLDDIKRFDNSFFGVNPREAASMDPQQRLLLELSFEALDGAGYLAQHRREEGDDVGCFIGASFVEYLDNTNGHSPTAYTSTGTIRAALCGRISYYYGWSGPAEVVDTACSSSLVAINRACRAIRGGECRMALAGGVNLITGINNYLDLAKAGFLSPTGQCKPFDVSADGYCRSEGGGLVVLKKLGDAVAEGDSILGVIVGSATNQGGRSAAMTVPEPDAQQALYQKVLDESRLTPDQVTYVEAHGTGTQAGDPIEMESIRTVFAKTPRQDTLHIGSIKGSIGHCETAAGVAGLLKVLAMLKHGQVPGQPNHTNLNPKIPPLEPDMLAIARGLQDWDVPFRASLVNGYGAAGSNCALICCEMPRKENENVLQATSTIGVVSIPLLVSAASQQGLRDNARALAEYLRSDTGAGLALADVAFTLYEKRQRHKYLAKVGPVNTIAEAADELGKSELPFFQITNPPKAAVLVFSGQTDNRVALHQSLYDQFPAFRFHIDNCDKELRSLGFSPLLPAIFQTHPIDEIATLQCGIFAVQYASARCWIDAGLEPRAVIGHSLGEITGLCIAGILSLRDSIKLVATRGHLVESKWGPEKGAMLALNCSLAEFENIGSLLERGGHGLELACHNSATSLVAVGQSAAIAAAENLLRTESSLSHIRFQRLSTSHGFHSALVEPILEDLTAVAKSLTWNKAAIRLEICSTNAFSSVLDSPGQYIANHARETVHFSQAIAKMEDTLGPCLWIEAGMDTPIINMVKKACGNPTVHSFRAIKTTHLAAGSEGDVVGDSIANLWDLGVFLSHWIFLPSPDEGAGADPLATPPMTRRCNQVWLPPYQFQKNNHWLDNIDRVVEMQEKCLAQNLLAAQNKPTPAPQPQLVTMKDAAANRKPKAFEFTINTQCQRFSKLVGGHVVCSRALCPASLYLECATMALQQLLGTASTINSSTLAFEQVRFHAPLGTEPDGEVILQLEQIDKSNHSPTWNFTVSTHPSSQSKSIVCHADGTLSLAKYGYPILDTFQRLVSSVAERLMPNEHEADKLMSKRAYGLFSRVVEYDCFFQGIQSVALHQQNEAVAVVHVPDGQPGRADSTAWEMCDSVMLDVCIQVAGLLVNSNTDSVSRDEVAVMTGLDRVVVAPGLCSPAILHNIWRVYTRIDVAADQQHFAGDVFVMSEKGEMVAAICGCGFAKLSISKLERSLDLATTSRDRVAPVESKHVESVSFTPSSTDTTNTTSPVLNTPDSSITIASTPHQEAGGTEMNYEALREIISEYTGLDKFDIAHDAMLGELGLDSLASFDLLEQLSSKFGMVVRANEIMLCSLASLGQQLDGANGCGNPAPTETTSASNCHEADVGGTNTTTNPFVALEATNAHFHDSSIKHNLENYWRDVAPLQSEITVAYIVEAFSSLGVDLRLFSQGQQVPHISHPIPPKYDRLLARLWEILQCHEIVSIAKHTGHITRGPHRINHLSSSQLLAQFQDQHPNFQSETALIELTGPNFANFLTGKADPISAMFGSPTSSNIISTFYSQSPLLSTMTSQLAIFLTNFLSRPNPSRPFRILEVGAGTGATTKRLAEVITSMDIPVQYTFTDISPSLVSKAKSKFKQYPWMEYATLDLENDNVPDRFRKVFDLVIGTNCVHATTDREAACRRLRGMLLPSGTMVLSEVTRVIEYYDITFGLLDGWWLAEGYPLRGAEWWMGTVKGAGFVGVGCSGGETVESNTQLLLVGCNLGWGMEGVGGERS